MINHLVELAVVKSYRKNRQVWVWFDGRYHETFGFKPGGHHVLICRVIADDVLWS